MTYRIRMEGIGMRRSAIKPSNVDAQRGLRVENIWVAKRGKAAPASERTTVVTASAEADTARYASEKMRIERLKSIIKGVYGYIPMV